MSKHKIVNERVTVEEFAAILRYRKQCLEAKNEGIRWRNNAKEGDICSYKSHPSVIYFIITVIRRPSARDPEFIFIISTSKTGEHAIIESSDELNPARYHELFEDENV